MAVVALAPSLVQAQSKQTQVHIVAFKEDMSEILVRVQDLAQGAAFQVREMDTNKVKKQTAIVDKADEDKQLKALTKKYKLAANTDQQDPKGRYMVMGGPDKSHGYRIMVLRGARIGVVGTVALNKEDVTKKDAKAMLKEVVWAPDGKKIMAVVNQKIDRQDGLEDVDEIHYFLFKDWKVKWLQPEPEEGAPSEEGGGDQ